MSVILDALKKLDREKASLREGTFDIAAEILRADYPPPRKRANLLIFTIALTLVTTLFIVYILLKFGFLKEPSPPPRVIFPQSGINGEPPLPETLPKPKTLPPSVKHPLVKKEVAELAPLIKETIQDKEKRTIQRKEETPPSKEKSSIEASPPHPLSGGKEVGQDRIIEKKETSSEISTIHSESSTNKTDIPPSLIKISAIVWAQDPSERFAMINGMKAIEGSFVEGMKVVEIYPSSVLFLYNNQYFEASILK